MEEPFIARVERSIASRNTNDFLRKPEMRDIIMTALRTGEWRTLLNSPAIAQRGTQRNLDRDAFGALYASSAVVRD